MPNQDYLMSWAKRAAADLREYAQAGEDAGSSQAKTEALVEEFDDILKGRPLWKLRHMDDSHATTLLDDL